MQVSHLTLCALAFAGFTSVAVIALAAPKTDAGSTTGTTAVSAAESATVGVINKVTNAVLESDNAAWASPLFKDAMLDILANSREMAILGTKSKIKLEANTALDTAARLVDIAIGRVDGEAGDNQTAHLNDWTVDSKVTNLLHGMLLQARNEVLRVKID